MRSKNFVIRNFQIIQNFYSNNKVYYVVENSNWVITEIAHSLKKNLGKDFKIVQTHKGVRNSIIHFGSVNSILTRKGINIPHQSNKIIVSYNHLVPNDPRHVYFNKLMNVVDFWHVTNSITRKGLILKGISSKKIILITLGIDLKKFTPVSKDEKVLLRKKLGISLNDFVIGSFQKDGNGWGEGLEPKLIKGPDIFCNVIEKLSKEVNFSVLLTGPARGYVKNRLKKSKIPFLHHYLKDQYQIVDYYKVIDLYFVTSRVEGGPMAILESLASGIPLITTKVGMANDIIKNKVNGVLVEVENETKFMDEAKSLMKNSVRRKEYIKNGLKTVNGYDWNIISNKMKTLYEETTIG